MEWDNIVPSPMQDESGTLGSSDLIDVIEALSDKNPKPSHLVRSSSFDRCIGGHETESTGIESASEPRGRTRPHGAPKENDVFLGDPHILQAELVHILCVLFDLLFTRAAVRLVNTIARILHPKHTHVAVV